MADPLTEDGDPAFEPGDDLFGADDTVVAPVPELMFEEPELERSELEVDVVRARLASLALDKPALAGRTEAGGRPKLPWVLLALFVLGGSAYHFHIVGRAAETTAETTAIVPPPAERAAVVSAGAGEFLAAGYLAARVPITIGVTASGRIHQVLVSNGDTIKKDQILATMEDGQIQAELALARAKERDAKRVLARTRTLHKAEAATQVDLDRAIGLLEIAQAERRVIAERMDQTRIRAPIDGTVLEVLAHPGEVLTVSPDTVAGVVRIADLTQLVAEVDVNEADIAKVRVSQPAEVTSDAHSEVKYPGRVREIAQQADRARGTVMVKVDLDAIDDLTARPGMAVKVRFVSAGPGPDRASSD